MNWPEQWKEIVTWTVGGLGLVILCVLATFPYKALQARLVAELQRATGMEIRVVDWTVELPMGLEWRNITLSRPEWEPIQLAGLQAKIGMVQALGGELGLDVIAHQNNVSSTTGLLKSSLAASSFSFNGPVTVQGQVQQVELSTIVPRYVTHGVLNGRFSHRLESARTTLGAMKGEGTWNAEATDVAVDRIPLGSGRTLALSFRKVTTELACRDSVCEVATLNGDGTDGSFTGTGTITLQQPIQNSQLALTVTLIPGTGFAAKAATLNFPSPPPGTPVTIKIVGTLAQTRVTL